jgi:predicted nucleic acid-binding protein
MKAFIDSDILIWHLRGKAEAKELLKTLTGKEGPELWIGAMQRAEIVFFMQKQEVESTMDLLSLFQTQSVDQEIIDLAGMYYRKWNPSHGIDPNDAILAASTVLRGGRIITQNTAHFPMPDIIVQKGW